MPEASILIVEDEAIVAADLTQKLHRLGYSVAGITAFGEEAVSLARQLLPHLILIDIQLAGTMDGIQAAELIRGESDVPVIFLTASSDRATMERANLTEPAGFILKPFAESEMATHIELALYKHQTERKLKESEARYRNIINNLQDGYIRTNNDAIVTMVSPSVARVYGLGSAEEMIGMPVRSLYKNPEARGTLLAELERQGRVFDYVCDGLRRDGSTIPVSLNVQYHYDERGEIQGTEAFIRDITERRQAEQILKASLHEKEILLQEIHHRVKNNLQIISSLVHLQSSNTDNATVREVLKEVTGRVSAMALVHEQLYRSRNFAQVPFDHYAHNLLHSIWRAHRKSTAEISLKTELQPIRLSVEKAVPCGLILNELITNVFKHAFQGRDQGQVTVSLVEDDQGLLHLSVVDDGIGFPPGFDWRQPVSLGLQLVQMLSRQLNATIAILQDGGTKCTLTFKQQPG